MTSQSHGGLDTKLKATQESMIDSNKTEVEDRVGASRVLVESCKARLECCTLNLEADTLKYQNAVAGFEKYHSITKGIDNSSLLDSLPLVRDKIPFSSSRCELHSRVRAGERARQKLQEAFDDATEELRVEIKSKHAENTAGRLSELGNWIHPSPKTASIEQLIKANQSLEKQLSEGDETINTQEEIIKIDAELFFQRNCIIQEQNAQLRDLEQLAKRLPRSEANLLAEKNNNIAQLERQLSNLQFENETLRSGTHELETQVKELTKKCQIYKERVRLANNSRDNARTRLDTVKAERDKAEADVSKILDLDYLVASCKTQSQQLTELALLFQQESRVTAAVPRSTRLGDDLSNQNRGPDNLSSANCARSESPKISIPHLRITENSHGTLTTPMTSELSAARTNVSEFSDCPPKLERPLSPLLISLPVLSDKKNKIRSPLRDKNNINGFLIFGHIYAAIEGVVVWSALLSSGAVVVWPLLLVADHIVYGPR